MLSEYDKYIEEYENSNSEYIINPITNKRLLKNGNTALKYYNQIMDYKNNYILFMNSYEDYIDNGKNNRVINPDTGRYINLNGKSAETLYYQFLEEENRIRKEGECISKCNVELKNHQKDVCKFISKDKNRGLILAFETGSGKTLTAITASQCLLNKNKNAHVLVLTPKSLEYNFRKEMEKYGIDPYDERYQFETISKFKNRKSYVCDKNTILIVDEAHNLRTDVHRKVKGKNTGTRTSAIIECAKNAWKVLLLTATPVYNSPYDMVNLVSMIKGIEPITKKQFESKILHNDTEFRKFFSCVIYFYENEKNEHYPEKKEHNVEIKMTRDYYKRYMNVEKNNNIMFKNPTVFLSGLRQATNALEDSQKPKWIIKKLKENKKLGKKTLIYSSFNKNGIEIVKSLLPKNGYEYAEVNGKMTKKQRDIEVKKYNSSEVDIMFITKAGGEGLDLKGTRTIILLEKGWNLASESQIIGRGVRYDSLIDEPKDENYVDIYYLILVKPNKLKENELNSADVLLKNIIESKRNENKIFFDKLKSLNNCK